MRKTKIICTLGPACDSEEMIEKLMLAGMNVARFNFSHQSHPEHKERYEWVDRVRRKLNLPVATLLDTRGPEIRLRLIENGKTELQEGQEFTLTTEDVLGNNERVSVTFERLPQDVSEGTHILIDDGGGNGNPLQGLKRRHHFQPEGRQRSRYPAVHALYQRTGSVRFAVRHRDGI